MIEESDDQLVAMKNVLREKSAWAEKQAQRAGLFLLAFEMLRNALRERLNVYYSFGGIVNESGGWICVVEPEFESLFEGAQQLDRQLEAWLNLGALSEEDAILIQELRDYRLILVEQLVQAVIDDRVEPIELGKIEDVAYLIEKLELWSHGHETTTRDPELAELFDEAFPEPTNSAAFHLLRHMIEQTKGLNTGEEEEMG